MAYYQSVATTTITGNYAVSVSTTLSGIIYVTGNITLSGTVIGTVTLVAAGSITVSGNNDALTSADSVNGLVLFGGGGDVTVTGSGNNFFGTIYCPNKNVVFNGSGSNYVSGCTYGQQVTAIGNGNTFGFCSFPAVVSRPTDATKTVTATPTVLVQPLVSAGAGVYPNPARGTMVTFCLDWAEIAKRLGKPATALDDGTVRVVVDVFDVTMRRIDRLDGGQGRELVWDLSKVANGIYLYRVAATGAGRTEVLSMGRFVVARK